MSKYGKYKKSVLKDYLVYSDEQIREMAINSLNNYAKLEKIEQLVSFILDDYGLFLYADSISEKEKHEHERLMLCCQLRGIVVSNITTDVEVTDEDIIKLIEKNRCVELKAVDSYSYRYDACYDEGKIIPEGSYFISDEKKEEINQLYDIIVDNIREDRKRKVKVYSTV